MKLVGMVVLFNIFACLVIQCVTSVATMSLETQGETLRNPALESDIPNVQICVRNCECKPTSSSIKSHYVAGTQKVTWNQAFVLCKQNGMELASITSVDKENALENYTKTIKMKTGPYEGYWLAGTRHGSSNSDFVWFTTGKPVIYRKFAAGQPDNAGGNEPCLEIFSGGPDIFLWNDIDCNQKLGFICQSS